MEMHQVRYFLAVARTLNFTRAAEQCNVSQPALTRAIRQLEEELAGKLLRREGKHSHLTDLGLRMVPLMQQCYESALAAKIPGLVIQEGRRAGPVARRCRTASPAGCWSARWPRCSAPFPVCSSSSCAAMPARSTRACRREGPISPSPARWGRTGRGSTAWPLFEERFELVVHEQHPLAGEKQIDARRLKEQRILRQRRAANRQDALAQTLEALGIVAEEAHQIGAMHDLLALLDSNLGIAFLPQSAIHHPALRRVAINGFAMTRPSCSTALPGASDHRPATRS